MLPKHHPLSGLAPQEIASIRALPASRLPKMPEEDWGVTESAFAYAQATGRPFLPMHDASVDTDAYEAHWRHCRDHGWLPMFASRDVAMVASPKLYSPPLRREVSKLFRGEIYWVACSEDEFERTLTNLGEPAQLAILPPAVRIPEAWDLRPNPSLPDPYRPTVIHVLSLAHELGASDVFFEDDRTRVEVRFRLSGVAEVFPPIRNRHRSGFMASLKKLAQVNPNETYKPHDKRFSPTLESGVTIDIRAAFAPTHTGETVGLRLQDSRKLIMSATKVPLPPRLLDKFQAVMAVQGGMVLVTGPTGSGKTTTLYSALLNLDRADLVIRTVEDPVEYTLPGISQVPVGAETGLTFPQILRSFLRLNPNVILVGEIRDEETAEVALEAALTGHTLLSTLHAPDCTETITRYIDKVPKGRVGLAAAMSLILAQRLGSRLCQTCKQPVPPTGEERELFQRFGLEVPKVVYRRHGCPECGTGLRGRVPIFEMVVITAALRDIIAAESGWSSKAFRKQWMSEGGQLMGAFALELAAAGLIEVSEAKRNMVFIPETPHN